MLKDLVIKTKEQHAKPLSDQPWCEVKVGNLAAVRDALAPTTVEAVHAGQGFPFKAWYAVIVRSGRERDAADGFRRESVTCYWPNYPRQVATHPGADGRGGRRVILAPIIPGMVFSPGAEAEVFWMALQRVPCVLNVLRGSAGAPATLTKADIDLIREIEAAQNIPPPVTPVHNLKVGQSVRFMDDVLSLWPPGKVERLLPEGRIRVEVYLMARMVPITVLPHQIEAM